MKTPLHAFSIALSASEPVDFSPVVAAGLDAVDLCGTSGDYFTALEIAPALHHAHRAAGDLGLRIVSLTLPPLPVEPDESTLAALRDAIQAAGQAGIVVVTLAPAVVTLAPAVVLADAEDDAPASYVQSVNGMHTAFAALAADAERAGLTLAVRAPSAGCLLSPVEVRELVDAAHSPSIGVTVDADRLRHIGRLEDWHETLRSRVVSVRGSAESLERYAGAFVRALEPMIIVRER